jgi:hypothetical protein
METAEEGGAMTSRETLECRIYMAEDAMYGHCDDLDRGLHDLESELKDLTATVHHELCESSLTPLEERAAAVLRAVEAFAATVDLDRIRDQAERIVAGKDLVDGYRRELGRDTETPGEGPVDRSEFGVLALAG